MNKSLRFLILLAAAFLLSRFGQSAAAGPVLRSGGDQAVHALVIGIDAYQNVRPLKGAAADARDIEGALRGVGVTDILALVDADATRDNLLRAVEQMSQRIKPGDLVVFSIAGHGSQEPERVKGSQPDGMDDVFLLAGFALTPSGSRERVIGREFNHFIKQFESRGASVLFVADTCHGGGLTREVDPRATQLSYRQVPRYTLTEDRLEPVGTMSEAYLTPLDFQRTAFLAAVDRKTKAPEVRIPGVAGFRGALSYAVARALQGGADADRDGRTTLGELFTNVKAVVYQLSDQRQNPVMLASPRQNLASDVAFRIESAAQRVVAGPRLRITAVEDNVPPSGHSVRVAALGAQAAALAGLEQREVPIEVVPSAAQADLVWDPKSRDVLASGDVVAYGVDKGDLPSVVDRAAAVLAIKSLAARSPQVVAVAPDDKVHHENRKVVVDVAGVAGRALVLFDLASDGTVQLLYPLRDDSPFISAAAYRLPVTVRAPFGADQFVAVTSEQRMLSLEQALQQLNGRRSAVQAVRMVERYAPRDARIGSIGLFTAP